MIAVSLFLIVVGIIHIVLVWWAFKTVPFNMFSYRSLRYSASILLMSVNEVGVINIFLWAYLCTWAVCAIYRLVPGNKVMFCIIRISKLMISPKLRWIMPINHPRHSTLVGCLIDSFCESMIMLLIKTKPISSYYI